MLDTLDNITKWKMLFLKELAKRKDILVYNRKNFSWYEELSLHTKKTSM